jgi:aminoglycoside 6'-N-acetyltransferase
MSAAALHGRRVTLRPLRREDLPRLLELLAEPEVARWWGSGYDEARLERDYLRPGSEETAFAILDGGGELAGMASYWEEDDPDHRHAGMDLFLDPARRGRGLGPDALATLARHLVDDRGHHRLVIDPAADNAAAIRAYAKVGFRPVGTLRRAQRAPDGGWRDTLLMELLAGELVA